MCGLTFIGYITNVVYLMPSLAIESINPRFLSDRLSGESDSCHYRGQFANSDDNSALTLQRSVDLKLSLTQDDLTTLQSASINEDSVFITFQADIFGLGSGQSRCVIEGIKNISRESNVLFSCTLLLTKVA